MIQRERRLTTCALLATTVVCWCGLAQPSAMAQLAAGRSYPTPMYYGCFTSYNAGNFRTALKAFQAAGRLGLRVGNNRWADSICYQTMIGECQYHLGQTAAALESYNQALRVFLMNPNWIRTAEFADGIEASQAQIRSTITWGARPTVMGDFSRKIPVMFGSLGVENVLQTGGVYAPAELRTVDVVEISRCTALALRRRFEILGPLCPGDPLTLQVLAQLESVRGRPNHWSQAWLEAQRGFALLAAGKEGEASDALARSLTIAGRFDHPLTGMSLFALGQLAERAEEYAQATQHYLQSSLAAAQYEQAALVGEALHRLARVHALNGAEAAPGWLPPATAWAKRMRFGQLQASLLVDAAEYFAHRGDTEQAEATLSQAIQTIGRRKQISIQALSRLSMTESLLHYQSGRAKRAEQAFTEAMAARQVSSPWLFQLSIVNQLFANNSEDLSLRKATMLYEELLREPTPRDWTTNTLETMAVMSTPHERSYHNWFDIAFERNEDERAIEIVERVRRHRFLSRLPLAGRVLSLRWMLEAPLDMLPPEVQERRNDLQTRYPRLIELSQQVAALRSQLRQTRMDAEEPEAFKSQTELAKQLHAASMRQEQLLGEIALRREDSPYVFPPHLTLDQVQSRLGEKQLVLAFFTRPKVTYAMMLSQEHHAIWRLPSTPNAKQGVSTFLRKIGMLGDASSLKVDQLKDDEWKVISRGLLRELIDAPQLGFWKKFDELIIVPDGFLWYLPFESLLVNTADNSEVPLIAATRIRYAPTIALGLPDQRNLRRDPRSAVVLGQLFPRDEAELSGQQFEELESVVEGLTALPERVPAPSGILRTTWDRLVVFDDINNKRSDVLEWAPAGFDQKRPQTNLLRWMALPWGGPMEVYLPGFHTAAETGLKRDANGDEVFFALTGLMASGARTIILSRWRTGGETSYNLMREYLQSVPSIPPSEAWQRAVLIGRDVLLNPNWEPRVTAPSNFDESITADHPFFWSGYILCDRGSSAAADAESPSKMREPAPAPTGTGAD